MAQEPAFNPRLGSFTSGVDGSSEGGRINTMRLNSSLSLLGVALVNKLRADGYKGKVECKPELSAGVWTLTLQYEGDSPPAAPALWSGHRVIARQKPAPPPPQPASNR